MQNGSFPYFRVQVTGKGVLLGSGACARGRSRELLSTQRLTRQDIWRKEWLFLIQKKVEWNHGSTGITKKTEGPAPPRMDLTTGTLSLPTPTPLPPLASWEWSISVLGRVAACEYSEAGREHSSPPMPLSGAFAMRGW